MVLALLLRFVVAKVIDRFAARAGEHGQRRRRLFAGARASRVVAATLPWRNERQQQRAQAMASLLKSIAAVVISLVAVFMVLDELGYDLAPLLASAGVVGVALGFGAQNLVKDFLAGVCMLLEDQFGVGDVVDLEKASGQVEAVGLRVTRLRDDAGVVWYVRNGEVLRTGNRSQGWSPISLDIEIADDEDLYRAADLVNTVAAGLAGDEQFKACVIEVPTVVAIEPVLTPRFASATTIAGDRRRGAHLARPRHLRDQPAVRHPARTQAAHPGGVRCRRDPSAGGARLAGAVRRRRGAGLTGRRSDQAASSEIAVAASALLTGQFTLASCAAASKSSAEMPGTLARTVSAMPVMPSPTWKVTAAVVSSAVGGVPALARPPLSCME